ncbi:HIT domain-containing protein [Candidatus Nomurabacteria bacterium]|nr:HIT domain-containing protein [Candidatus Nomurabacteria bacterium]
MNDCIFCDIVNKTSPATFLYEDEEVAVIETIEPISKGHVLVIPKHHYVNILDIDNILLERITAVTKNIAKGQISKHHAGGVNVLHAAGKAAQQSVFHFHIHIVPRYEDDNLDLWFRNNL